MSDPNLEDLLALTPFAARLGIELSAAAPEEVRGRMAHAPELCTAGGVLHGGALMALADSLGAVCAYLNLPAGATTTTISSHTSFLRAVRQGHVSGCAQPLQAGRSVIVVQTTITDDGGRPVAQTTQAQAVRGGG